MSRRGISIDIRPPMAVLQPLVNGWAGHGPTLSERGTCADSDGRGHACSAEFPTRAADHAPGCPWVAAVALVETERSATEEDPCNAA